MLILAALALLGLAAYSGSKLYDGFRAGEMQVLDGSIIPIFFFRKFEPILFWITAVFNGAITTAMAGSSVMLLVQGLRK